MRTTSKPVVDAIRAHILEQFDADHYDSESTNTPLQNMIEQIDYMRYGGRTIYKTAIDWVEGGSALIYYYDVRDFLALILEESDEEKNRFTDDQVWRKYCHLVAREITKLYEGVK